MPECCELDCQDDGSACERETATFQIRHGTQDQEVYDQVVINNQYRLPDELPGNSVVIDIGANVGAFAVACLARGAGTVVCFEPCPLNFQQLMANVSPWPGQAPCFNAAVWRSDKREKISFVSPGANTACGGVTAHDVIGAEVTAMGLDELIYHVTNGGERRVDLIKIDAEGAEYPILYTCKHLGLVDKIIGETHQYPCLFQGERIFAGDYSSHEATAVGMREFLESQDFVVQMAPESEHNNICTLFWATKRTIMTDAELDEIFGDQSAKQMKTPTPEKA